MHEAFIELTALNHAAGHNMLRRRLWIGNDGDEPAILHVWFQFKVHIFEIEGLDTCTNRCGNRAFEYRLGQSGVVECKHDLVGWRFRDKPVQDWSLLEGKPDMVRHDGFDHWIGSLDSSQPTTHPSPRD